MFRYGKFVFPYLITVEKYSHYFIQLCEVQAKAMRPSSAVPTIVSDTRHLPGSRASQFCLYDIFLNDKIHGFLMPDTDSFVMIDLLTAKKLEILQGQDGVYTKAVLEVRFLKQFAIKKGKQQPFNISINIYGPESDASDIGKRLAEAQGSLQHPFYFEDGVEYLNPQFFQLEDKPTYMTNLVGMDESQLEAKALSDTLETVLTTLDRPLGNTIISEVDVIPDDLVTPLKEWVLADFKPLIPETNRISHQKFALSFILKREDVDYCDRIRKELLFHTRVL